MLIVESISRYLRNRQLYNRAITAPFNVNTSVLPRYFRSNPISVSCGAPERTKWLMEPVDVQKGVAGLSLSPQTHRKELGCLDAFNLLPAPAS